MLARLVEFPTQAIQSEGSGWKVIIRIDRWTDDGRLVDRKFQNIVHGDPPPAGEWASARNSGQSILAESGDRYPAGFHILLDEPDKLPGPFASEWVNSKQYIRTTYVLVRVRYRQALCAGVDGGELYQDGQPHPCVVAAEMCIETASLSPRERADSPAETVAV